MLQPVSILLITLIKMAKQILCSVSFFHSYNVTLTPTLTLMLPRITLFGHYVMRGNMSRKGTPYLTLTSGYMLLSFFNSTHPS